MSLDFDTFLLAILLNRLFGRPDFAVATLFSQ